jgi:hypothetical protein
MEKDTTPPAGSYSQEAFQLNNLIIKIKREILNGNIKTLTTEEVDEATIPALTLLRKIKPVQK